MSLGTIRIFLSHAGEAAFEAGLLQYAIEHKLADLGVHVWTYRRDQDLGEQDIAGSLKARIRESSAVVFLVTPSTFEASRTQWMELAYADAFEKPVFILLHRLQFADLATRYGAVPPLVLASQCNDAALDWAKVIEALRQRVTVDAGVGG